MGWYLFFLYLHIVLAAFWVGGMLFLPLVILPSINNNPQRRNILIKSGLKWRYYGWISLIGLMLTGILNMYFKGMLFNLRFLFHSSIGMMVLVKLLVFAGIILILVIHDVFIGKKIMQESRYEDAYTLKIARYSGRINLILSLLAVLLGVFISRGITIF